LDLRKEKRSKPKPAKVTTFLPESQRFKIPFIFKQVAKDGNCLFGSILAAQGLNDSSHLQLRSRCADSVVAAWNNYAAYANFSHRPDTNIQSKLGRNPQGGYGSSPAARSFTRVRIY
jgi:hypothetical protein